MLVSNMTIEEILRYPALESVMYNYDSEESFNDAKILCGNPNGILNFNRTPHAWATTLYDRMHARDWFPNRINMVTDKKNYTRLTPLQKRAYRLVLAQLITNDSVQADQLSIEINKYITSPVVGACLIRQAYEETVHSRSYTVMAEDVCNESDIIYNLHKVNKQLELKNRSVADMYKQIYKAKNDDVIRIRDVLLAFVANQILEELVFPGGFALMYTLEDLMPGTASMIGEIHKDESLSHVPLFRHIFNSAINELFGGTIPGSLVEEAHAMIKSMTDAEKKWTKYIANVNQDWVNEQGKEEEIWNEVGLEERQKTLPSFSEQNIDIFIEGQANSVCVNLGFPKLYDSVLFDKNPLRQLVARHLAYSREAVFELHGKEYSNDTELGF